ncbi:MAG: RagB/SusD family nutrient uptake outer membrane protein [Bacteroidota bacterium]
MKMKLIRNLAVALVFATSLTSCFKDLDLAPEYGLNAETVYSNPDNYIHVLAKLYAGFTMTGNKGPAGAADIGGIDEGFSQYTRVLWNLQELPTDEAICGWNDPGMPEMNKMAWSPENPWVKGMYYRIYFEIAQCNEFIRNAADDKLSERGFSESDVQRIRLYRTEARFLRALTYYHLMDLYGHGPFIPEDQGVGSYFPTEYSRQQLFTFIESELIAIKDQMGAPRFEYGRADKAAVWTLLAKLYLNSKVYINTERYDECAAYCDSVINCGAYSIEDNYRYLFLTDNNLCSEVILPIICDGRFTQSYGGTTFLVHASVGGQMLVADFGIAPGSGWAGLRAKRNLPLIFNDSLTDTRYNFFKNPPQIIDNTILTTFTNGYGVTKWKNLDRANNPGSDPTKTFVDTDFPMFRLADIYLMYIECATRGAANLGIAQSRFQELQDKRRGAGASTSVLDVSSASQRMILDERMRELYWEGHRRTDLIRYGLFTSSSYVWPWKGGTLTGTAAPVHLDLYPIPSSDLTANPNLTQNPGY